MTRASSLMWAWYVLRSSVLAHTRAWSTRRSKSSSTASGDRALLRRLAPRVRRRAFLFKVSPTDFSSSIRSPSALTTSDIATSRRDHLRRSSFGSPSVTVAIPLASSWDARWNSRCQITGSAINGSRRRSASSACLTRMAKARPTMARLSQPSRRTGIRLLIGTPISISSSHTRSNACSALTQG